MTMWWFGKRTARQKEIRRSKAERRQSWARRLPERVNLRAAGMLLAAAVAAGWLVNQGPDRLDLRIGQRLPRAITSRVDFRIQDEARTRAMRVQARDNAEMHYRLDTSLLQDVRGRLASALRIAREQAADPVALRAQAAEIKVLLDDAGLAELVRIAELPESSLYEQAVERAIQTLRRQPLVEAHELARRRTAENAILVDPEQATERPVSILRLLSSNVRDDVVQAAQRTAEEFPPALRGSVAASLLAMLAGDRPDTFKPLYRYDAARSLQAAAEAEARVPPQYDEYPVGARLADAGVLTREELELLQVEHAQYEQWVLADPAAAAARRRTELARGLLCGLIVLGLGSYVIARYDRVLGSIRQRLATTVTLLLVVALARAAALQGATPYVAVGAQALAVTLLAITAAPGVTLVTSGLLALVLALATRQGVGFVLVLVAVALVLAFGLRDLRNRGRVIAAGAAAAVVATGLSVLVGLMDGQGLWHILRAHAVWAGVTTLVAAFLVEGLLPGIERLFGVTTSMTLLEWCDPNKPLLRMLAAESPGTYNHSLLVGTLADAAAEAIGANGLLARSGAYYHDIGKINKPEYFVENQAMGVGNRHDRLSPAMSHLIIIGHVKDGIEMAKEYGLPAALRPFIPEHHGTSVVEYFYHAASRARRPGDPEVSDTEFRYPGPKPRSRETAIVMLCDGVEGAVRAMPEPTPGRIEDTVERIIQKRLMDGQLDDCDLTFRELEIIRRSLVKSLNSIYHGRIVYPSEKPAAESRSAS